MKLIFLLLLQIGGCCVFAQDGLYYLGIEDGLSNNEVTSIFQDHNGFMWFGTYDGLNRYDGYKFEIFRNYYNDTNSLADNRIVCMNEDKSDNLWIGTKLGISIYNLLSKDLKALYYFPYQSNVPLKLSTGVTCIERDDSGSLFIGTDGKGMIVKRPGETNGYQIPYRGKNVEKKNYPLQSVTIGDKGAVWCFVRGAGLCRYDYKRQTVLLADETVRQANCIKAAGKDKIWIGTQDGLYGYDLNKKQYTHYTQRPGQLTSNRVVSISLDKDENIWVGTDGGGIDVLMKDGQFRYIETSAEKTNSLTSGAVYAIYEDRNDRKWIGTLRGGINVIDNRRNRFHTISGRPTEKNSLVNNFVLSLCEDKDSSLWIGTDGGGLSLYNQATGNYTNFTHQLNQPSSLSNNFITRIIEDAGDNIWLATYGGNINRYIKSKKAFEEIVCRKKDGSVAGNVWTLFEDRNKNLWAGTIGDGLFRYNKNSREFELAYPDVKDVLCLTEDRRGNLWAGNFNKLIKIDRAAGEIVFFNIARPVRSILEAKDGKLWLATEGGGLVLFDPATERLKRFTTKDGLPNNAILNLLQDDSGNIWMSTYTGISEWVKGRKLFRNFDQSDGLQANQFNYNAALRLRSGQFVFGGIKGYTIFYPDSISSLNQNLPLLVTGVRINNQPVYRNDPVITEAVSDQVKSLRLPDGHSTVTVNFVALNYSSPGKISYSYFLEGWDKYWIGIGTEHVANYTRLNKGSYVLHIRAKQENTASSEIILYIRVLPPWYQTWWAFALYAIAAVSVVYLYTRYKARQARLEYEVKLAYANTKEERELSEQQASFFTHVSHEFRTPLMLIISPLKDLIQQQTSQKDKQTLSVVHRNARRLLSLVDQLLLFRKAESKLDDILLVHMNLANLCQQVYESFVLQYQNKNVQLGFHTSDGSIDVYADKEKLEVIFYNLLSNALKYTPSGGRVDFCLKEMDNEVLISVSDTGVGIPAEARHRVFDRFYRGQNNNAGVKGGFGIGLFLSSHFVKLHNGTLTCSSNSAGGAIFEIKLPKGKERIGKESFVEETPGESPVLLEELIGVEREFNSEEALVSEPVNHGADELVTDRKTILVIEDNDDIRKYISDAFVDTFHIYEAGNGDDGLRKALEFIPDIIISDIMMEGKTGLELCLLLKSNPSLNHIPVILVTADLSTEIKLKGIQGGADDYLTKPFDRQLLVARVDSLIKSRNNLQKYFYSEVTYNKSSANISVEDKYFIDRCIEMVENNIDNEEFEIKQLATGMGMSHSNLYRKIKAVSGQSANSFVRLIRLRKAAQLLITTNKNINETAFEVGFNDVKYFREQFLKLFGMNPSDYMKKFRGRFPSGYKFNREIFDKK